MLDQSKGRYFFLWSTITHDHFAKPWSTITHDHTLKISWSAITIMIGDHFADHHCGYIESKICISMCQFFENLLKYMILPQIFWFPRKIFLTWEKIKCTHQKTANIFSWDQNFMELFLKIGDFPKICDCQSFYDHSQNIWSMITHDHDRQILEKYDLQSLMIVIWSEMIGDHDPIRLTL